MSAGKTEYHAGRLTAYTKLIVGLVKNNPRLLDDENMLRSMIHANLPPELRGKEHCLNCGASMKEYVYSFDSWDALLLIKMGEEVRRRMTDMDFTIANQVRIPELEVTHALKCRTTQAAKLGLIAQLMKGKKRVPGVWVITSRGWDALAGKPVPAKVKVWRKKIEERFDETITMAAALKSHTDYVAAQIKKGREPKQDYRSDATAFNPADWFEFGIHQGRLV